MTALPVHALRTRYVGPRTGWLSDLAVGSAPHKACATHAVVVVKVSLRATGRSGSAGLHKACHVARVDPGSTGVPRFHNMSRRWNPRRAARLRARCAFCHMACKWGTSVIWSIDGRTECGSEINRCSAGMRPPLPSRHAAEASGRRASKERPRRRPKSSRRGHPSASAHPGTRG